MRLGFLDELSVVAISVGATSLTKLFSNSLIKNRDTILQKLNKAKENGEIDENEFLQAERILNEETLAGGK